MARKTTGRKKGTPERDIENACIGYLLRRGWFTWKNGTTGVYDFRKKAYYTGGKYAIRGAADAIAIKNGHVAFIEFKTPKGRLSDHQKDFRDNVEKHGGTYVVIRSLEELQEWLDGLEKAQEPSSSSPCFGWSQDWYEW